MFDNVKRKAQRATMKTLVVLVAFFIVEHAAGAALIETGILQGRIVTPEVAFGGYDAKHEKQVAMLTGALDEWQLKPADVKPVSIQQADPKPGRKPAQVKAVR